MAFGEFEIHLQPPPTLVSNMRKTLVLLLLLIINSASYAQQIRSANSAKIYHELCQMRHLVNVLYVAAHPDDENTRLLSWLVNDQHIRTAYLSLTRGDGGQNILGTEQGDALGLIRTHELLEARKIDGAEQFFTRAVDFGFSKNFQETFHHWLKDTLIADAALVMREYRPDVVICRFPPDTMAGHGHHAASAIIGAAAFKAAGDATQYKDQIGALAPWHPKRILFNAFRFGTFNTTTEDMFKLKVGQYEPLIGMATGEIAGASRSVHKSQGAGTPSVAGVQNEYFRLVDGDPFTNSIFDGIDITWNRVGRPDIGTMLDDIIAHYDFLHPEASISDLLKLKKLIAGVTDEYWRTQKLSDIDRIILDCSGLMTEIYCKSATATPGDTLTFTLHVIARAGKQVNLVSCALPTPDGIKVTTIGAELAPDSLFTGTYLAKIPEASAVTQPYWLEQPADGALFHVNERKYLGLPETPDSLYATINLQIEGENFYVKAPLSCKKLDPLKGDVVEPIRIMPGVTLAYSSNLLMAKADGIVEGTLLIHTYGKVSNGSITLTSAHDTFNIASGINFPAGCDTILPFRVKLKKDKNNYNCNLVAELKQENSKIENKTLHLIQYSHIPTLQYFTTATAKVIDRSWLCKAKKIGYIEGAGDNVAQTLRLAGLDVDILKNDDFQNADKLKKYDAIITGIRAFNVEKNMATWIPVLLKYTENGGTLIVQYNTLQDPVTTKYGPYPITLSGKRVTEEDAEITFLDPANKILNTPNKITTDDFNDWVQERGLYFPSKWDEHYIPLFSMHDAGEQPLTGSTLFAKFGKGNYIYTSLSFSRQIPAGNAGAIRLLMNMMSIGK